MMRFLFLILIVSNTLLGQVNTEELRKHDIEAGIYHKIDFGLGIIKGNSELIKIDASYRIDFLEDKNNLFFIMNYSYNESNKKTILNKGFAHLRGVRDLYDYMQAEAFIQKEFNEFILLKDRNLVGAGLRFLPFEYDNDEDTYFLKFFLGSGLMYEYEHYNIEKDNITNLIRSTNYLTMDWKANDNIRLSTTLYFQFVPWDFKDQRILNETSVNFKISDNLKFYTKVNYRMDNQPPAEIKNYDMEITNGITVKF